MPQQQACRTTGIVAISPCAVPGFQPDTRAAYGTRNRLRVKASVGGILVLGAARITEVESSHGCVGAIVGNGLDDRKTWSAMRAVRKRITVTAIRRVGDLSGTVRADHCVRRDPGLHMAGLA